MTRTKTKDASHFPISIRVPEETLLNLITSAVETGSRYWADFTIHEQTRLYYLRVEVTEHEPSGDALGPHFEMTPELMALGVQRLAKCAQKGEHRDGSEFPAAAKYLCDVIRGDDDALTADVVLQLAMFGTLVYG